MANRRIIDLPEAGTITDGDYYHVSQSGIDKRVPHSTLVGVLSADLADKIDAVEALVNEATLASNIAISAKDEAVASAGAAQDSETAAEMSEANASSSELNAADSELMSQKWAANPENEVVEGGLYSSRHYMAKAAESASISQGVEQTVLTAQADVQQSASNALTSENNAEASANSSANSATLADTRANAAAASSTLANKWAENPEDVAVEAGSYSALHHAAKALVSQNLAQTAATTATTQAGLADTARVASEDARDAAISARNAAQAAQTAAEQVYDQFDDRYLGSKSSDPTTDNDGGALLTGALYYRTTAPIGMRVWDGSMWDMAYASIGELDGGTY